MQAPPPTDPGTEAFEEAERSTQRQLGLNILAMSAWMGIAVFIFILIPGEPAGKIVGLSAAGVGGLAQGLTWRLRRKPEFFERPLGQAALIARAVAGWTAVYAAGILSPLCAVIALGIVIGRLSLPISTVRMMLGANLGCYLFYSLGACSGWLPDIGLLFPLPASPITQGVSIFITTLIIVSAMLIGHRARVEFLDAQMRLQSALLGEARRDALLKEAQQALRHALRVGEPGRFTGQVFGSFRLGVVLAAAAWVKSTKHGIKPPTKAPP